MAALEQGAGGDAHVHGAAGAEREDLAGGRSAIVGRVLTVRVSRSRRGKVFDPESVELQWRSA